MALQENDAVTIAGTVVAGVAIIISLVLGFLFCTKYRNRCRAADEEDGEPPIPLRPVRRRSRPVASRRSSIPEGVREPPPGRRGSRAIRGEPTAAARRVSTTTTRRASITTTSRPRQTAVSNPMSAPPEQHNRSTIFQSLYPGLPGLPGQYHQYVLPVPQPHPSHSIAVVPGMMAGPVSVPAPFSFVPPVPVYQVVGEHPDTAAHIVALPGQHGQVLINEQQHHPGRRQRHPSNRPEDHYVHHEAIYEESTASSSSRPPTPRQISYPNGHFHHLHLHQNHPGGDDIGSYDSGSHTYVNPSSNSSNSIGDYTLSIGSNSNSSISRTDNGAGPDIGIGGHNSHSHRANSYNNHGPSSANARRPSATSHIPRWTGVDVPPPRSPSSPFYPPPPVQSPVSPRFGRSELWDDMASVTPERGSQPWTFIISRYREPDTLSGAESSPLARSRPRGRCSNRGRVHGEGEMVGEEAYEGRDGGSGESVRRVRLSRSRSRRG